MSKVIGPTTKRRLFVAQQVVIYVVLPSVALGFYLGSQATASAQSHTDQVIKAALATPTPVPTSK